MDENKTSEKQVGLDNLDSVIDTSNSAFPTFRSKKNERKTLISIYFFEDYFVTVPNTFLNFSTFGRTTAWQ